MQFVHCTSDREMTEKRLSSAKWKNAYAWRSLIDAGAIIPGGSDAPVELVNPMHGIYAAVTRKDRFGRPAGGWQPEEKLTRVEAVKAFTIWAAYSAFEESVRGSIEPGKAADFTVIDRDILNCPEDEIKDISVIATVLSGQAAYVSEGVDMR
jgi:predicted amidohydrolase YtcJ